VLHSSIVPARHTVPLAHARRRASRPPRCLGVTAGLKLPAITAGLKLPAITAGLKLGSRSLAFSQCNSLPNTAAICGGVKLATVFAYADYLPTAVCGSVAGLGG